MVRSIVRRRIPVTAISSDDVVGLLRRLDLYNDIISGRAKCFICERRVTLENIGGILEVSGKIVLICDNPGCIARAAILSKERQRVAGPGEES